MTQYADKNDIDGFIKKIKETPFVHAISELRIIALYCQEKKLQFMNEVLKRDQTISKLILAFFSINHMAPFGDFMSNIVSEDAYSTKLLIFKKLYEDVKEKSK